MKNLTTINYQVPHAFQEILSAESTPTLCYSILAFSAFIERWEELQLEEPHLHDIIEQGLNKLRDYQEELPKTPAYTVAMGKLIYISDMVEHSLILIF